MQYMNSGSQQFEVISIAKCPRIYTPHETTNTPFSYSTSKSSMYIQNKMGDITPPFLTPLLMLK